MNREPKTVTRDFQIRSYRCIGFVSLTVFLADFFIKKALKPYLSHSFPIIKNVVHITVVYNKGAAFGLFQTKGTLLIFLSIILIFVLFFLVRTEREYSALINLSYGLILGGAFSNLYDRLIYGYVVDYIDLRIWPVFNLSDASINIGIVSILLKSLKARYREKRVPNR